MIIGAAPIKDCVGNGEILSVPGEETRASQCQPQSVTTSIAECSMVEGQKQGDRLHNFGPIANNAASIAQATSLKRDRQNSET
jgi:hypothetical protein